MKNEWLRIMLMAVILAVASGCRPKKEVAATEPAPDPVVVEQPAPEPPVNTCGAKLGSGPAPWKDPIARLDGGITGDCLELKVSYSGGCKEHGLDLYWAGGWDKSIPAVAHLNLSHQSNGDGCEAIKSEKLSFDLRPIRTPGSGQVIVEVHGEGVPMLRLNYTY